MSMSLSQVNDAINSYTKKMSERGAFVSKAGKLISDASQASIKLGSAAKNLETGLIINGKSADDGKINEMVITLNKNVSTLQSAVNLANSEIKDFGIKLVNLKREKQRIMQAARDADREKNVDNNTNRTTLKEALE